MACHITPRLQAVPQTHPQTPVLLLEHATQCNALFNKYIVLPEVVPDPTIMDDQLARFTLWALDMDVYGPLNVSLDYRLRFSSIVVKIIHQLLEVICDTLASLKPIDGPPQTPNRKRQCISEHGDSEVKRRADDDASDSDDDVDPKENRCSNAPLAMTFNSQTKLTAVPYSRAKLSSYTSLRT
ncbi:hypothetical protein F4825DRAFT_116175 [Nemania diffusa]|nr:hypothetical protein F4825DRAFT_116175 [Nemania diffusa]